MNIGKNGDGDGDFIAIGIAVVLIIFVVVVLGVAGMFMPSAWDLLNCLAGHFSGSVHVNCI
jgi:hypothetical protein